MLKAAVAVMQDLGGAKVGDKTMMDALVPAVEEYEKAVAEGASFSDALNRMTDAAEKGKEGHSRNDRKVGPRQPPGGALQGNPRCGRCILFAHSQDFLRYVSKRPKKNRNRLSIEFHHNILSWTRRARLLISLSRSSDVSQRSDGFLTAVDTQIRPKIARIEPPRKCSRVLCWRRLRPARASRTAQRSTFPKVAERVDCK